MIIAATAILQGRENEILFFNGIIAKIVRISPDKVKAEIERRRRKENSG